MKWTSSFENSPGGSDFGSITASALRGFKAGVRQYLEVEHEFDTSDSPDMKHKRGYCSVVKEVESIEPPYVRGAVQVNSSKAAVRIGDTPVTTQVFGGFNHQDLQERGNLAAHNQYLRLADDRTIEKLSVGRLTGLAHSYSSPKDDEKIMSQGEHDIDGSGIAKHKDDCITLTGFLGGLDIPFRCLLRNASIEWVNSNGDYTLSVPDNHIFFPTVTDADAYVTLNPDHGSTSTIKCRIVNYQQSFDLEGRYIEQ